MDGKLTLQDYFFAALFWILFVTILFKVFQILVKRIRKLFNPNMEEEKREEYQREIDQLRKENDQLREIISNQSEAINYCSQYLAGIKKQD